MEIKTLLDSYNDFWTSMNSVYDRWAKLHNLTVNAAFALQIMSTTPNCTQSIICDKLFLPKQTVNALLDSFIKNGYADKKISALDRRSKLVFLTQKGQTYANYITDEMASFEGNALRKMTPQEQESMVTTSHLFLKHLSDSLKSNTCTE